MLWISAFTVLALNIADLITTKLILARGGVEANPAVAWAADGPIFTVLKLVAVPLLLAGIVWMGKHSPKGAVVTMGVIAAGYLLIVANNLNVLAVL